MVKLLTEPWGERCTVIIIIWFLVKNWPIFYMKLTLNFYERNVIEEAVNALFCEREIINNKNIIKKLMFFLSDVNHTKKDVVQSALNIIIDITSGDI